MGNVYRGVKSALLFTDGNTVNSKHGHEGTAGNCPSLVKKTTTSSTVFSSEMVKKTTINTSSSSEIFI